jgi:hypothetical protein
MHDGLKALLNTRLAPWVLTLGLAGSPCCQPLPAAASQ